VAILVISGVLALGPFTWRPLAARAGRHSAVGVQERDPASPALATAALQTAVIELEAGRGTTPLLAEAGPEGDITVTFFAKRDGSRVPRVVSDITGWGERLDGTFDFNAGRMARVGRSDWYFLQARVAARARIEYLLAYGLTDYRLDPRNPRQTAGRQFGGLHASEFVTAGYVAPQEFVDAPPPPAGTLSDAAIDSRVLGIRRRLIVYTPPGYRAGGNYPVATFLDLRAGQSSRVLDWLIARQDIEPVVALFEGPSGRGLEEPTGAPLRDYLGGELMPWLASRYSVTASASERAVLAVSYGGKDAVNVALPCERREGVAAGQGPPAEPGCRIDAFGRLGLLIPGRRMTAADVATIGRRPGNCLRVAILAGKYDRSNLPTARALRTALAAAGHDVDYIEVPEGHSAVTWTHHLREVLVSLFGRSPRTRRHGFDLTSRREETRPDASVVPTRAE
jgi:enterochelin esterase-like enzyme